MPGFSGIDVGAKCFGLAHRRNGKVVAKQDFAQTPHGHQLAVECLLKLQPQIVVLEATGIYYLDLAVALKKAGLPVAVINPKSYHHFAKLKLLNSKTDDIDRELLAEYGERMTPKLWEMPDPARLALRDIGRQINRLTATRTQAKNRLHALRSTQTALPILIDDEIEGIAVLTQRIKRLTQGAVALLAQHPALAEQARQLDAAKGVALASAIAILAELCVLPQELRSAQVSRYAGLDVRICESGTSVKKVPRLSKAGNAYLRAALYMPALTAMRFDPHARAFYQALLRREKKKMQAIAALMRKMLTGFWACLKTNTPYDSSKLFSEIHFAKS